MCNPARPCIGVEKTFMKVLFLFLLVAGPFCVWGQVVPALPVPGRRQALPLPEVPGRRQAFPLPELQRPEVPGLWPGDRPLERRLILSGRTGVRIMRPDGMACVVPDWAWVERMPVDRRGSADRMPNGVEVPKKGILLNGVRRLQ